MHDTYTKIILAALAWVGLSAVLSIVVGKFLGHFQVDDHDDRLEQ